MVRQRIGLDRGRDARSLLFRRGLSLFSWQRPEGGDRVPDPDEIANCARWHEREIALLEPELLLPVGKLAIAQFLPEPLPPLTEIIGRKFSIERAGRRMDVIPLPHPSGASPWHRTEPGLTLLKQALALVARHSAVQACVR